MKWLKRIIVTLIIFLTIGCAVTAPSWYNIGSEKTAVELCRDTVTYEQLDSVCKSHGIYPSEEEWSTMIYHNKESKETMNQYMYTRGQDTLYTITNFGGEKCIFTMRVNQ